MSKLNASKRNRLAVLALITTVVISLYWVFVIRIQQEWLADKRAAIESLRQKIHIGKVNAAKLPQFQKDLKAERHRLLTLETDMANGDVYRWLVRTFLSQTTNDIVENVTPPRMEEVSVLPKVPYQEAVFTISGKAYYHDFGKFLSGLENNFIHMRVRRLDLESVHAGDPTAEGAEKLLFVMEVSTLVNIPPPKP